MKAISALLFALFGCVSPLLATEFTWTGGGTDTGVWTDSANWGVSSGYPQAGDTAIFSQSATITESFSLGGTEGTTDVLVMTTTVSSVEVKLEGTVSGEGGLRKTGEGVLRLYAENTFKGDFTTQCVYINEKGDMDSSPVYVYHDGALGQGKVYIDPDTRANGCHGRIYFYAGAGQTLTITNDIDIGNANKPERGKLYFMAGNFVLTGAMTSHVRAYITGNSACESVHFTGSWMAGTGNGYFHMPGFGANTTLYFDGEVVCGTFYTYNCNAGTVHLKTPPADTSKGITSLTTYTPIVLDGDNALGTYMRRFGLNDAKASLDLNGHTQSFPNLWGSGDSLNYFVDGSYITSPLGNPGTLKIGGVGAKGNNLRCPLTGALNLVASPQASGTLWISNCVNTTVGDVTVTSGQLGLSGGAQFTRLETLAVSNNATLLMQGDIAGDCHSRKVYLASKAKIDIADGRAWETSHFYVNGVEQTDKTTYTSNDCTQIVGGGVVRVVSDVNTFVGGGADAAWNNVTNWYYGVVPVAGEAVAIAAPVTLTDSTPNYGSVTVQSGGTITFANETACLVATNVSVASGGLITSVGPFTDAADAARVFIGCTNLTIAVGGAIDVSSKGWSGAPSLTTMVGCGPGAGQPNFGASHGGYGGRRDLKATASLGDIYLHATFRYGDPDEPVTYGSGGSRAYKDSASVHGGGAIRLAVTGALVVNGEVRADGGACNPDGALGTGSGDTGGAGGSVWITCGTLEGSGLVSAAGGNGSSPLPSMPFWIAGSESYQSRPGGGGRVSVTCDTTLQAAKAPAVRLSAAAGRNLGWGGGHALTLATDDLYFTDAEPGTLATDDVLFGQLLGKGLSGRVSGHSTVTVNGDLAYTWGHLRFEGAGADFHVTGNLAISGADSRLEIGQGVVTNLSIWNYKWAGAEQNKLRVGGDLSVTGGAALDVRAAEKSPALTDFGATVDVVGKMTIGAGAYVYAWCDGRKAIPVKFDVGSLEVQAGGFFSADDRGAAGGWGGNNEGYACGGKETMGFGNGATSSGGMGHCGGGGSHGGLGGVSVWTNGVARADSYARSGAEADPYLPTHPGAGGSCDGYGSASPAGGGVIYVLAKGAIRVDGTVSADSVRVSSYYGRDYMHYIGAGAGGTVFLYGDTFASGDTARISARGGDTPTTRSVGGAGGGGCIAIWTGRGNLKDGTCKPTQIVRHAVETTPASLGYAGAFDVTGGTNVYFAASSSYPTWPGKEIYPESHGGVGTIRFAHVRERYGMILFVR